MENMQSIPTDLQSYPNSWFTWPLVEEPISVEDPGPLACSFPDPSPVVLELDNTLRIPISASYDPSIDSAGSAPLEMEDMTSDRSEFRGSFSSYVDTTAPNANTSLLSLLYDIPPPTYDVMPSLGCFVWPTLLGDHPLHDRPSSDWLTDNARLMNTFPSPTALGMECSHDVPRFCDTLPASGVPIICDELASPPISIERGFFSPPAEDVPQSQDHHMSCISQDCAPEAFPVHTSSTPSALRDADVVTPLAQRTYTAKSQKQPFSEAKIVYEPGYRLDEDKSGIDDIVDYDKVAFPGKEFRQKASFRLEMDGYESYTSQLNVATKSGPPTKGRFAGRTVDFMRDFLKKYEQGGKPKPFPYKLHDLVLLRIELVSSGSVQPFFGVVTVQDTV